MSTLSAAENTANAVKEYLEDCSAAERWPSEDAIDRIFRDNFAPILRNKSYPSPSHQKQREEIAEKRIEELVDAAMNEMFPYRDYVKMRLAITNVAKAYASALDAIRQRELAERDLLFSKEQSISLELKRNVELLESELSQAKAEIESLRGVLGGERKKIVKKYYEIYSPLIGRVVGVTTEAGKVDADASDELRPITKAQYDAFRGGTP